MFTAINPFPGLISKVGSWDWKSKLESLIEQTRKIFSDLQHRTPVGICGDSGEFTLKFRNPRNYNGKWWYVAPFLRKVKVALIGYIISLVFVVMLATAKPIFGMTTDYTIAFVSVAIGVGAIKTYANMLDTFSGKLSKVLTGLTPFIGLLLLVLEGVFDTTFIDIITAMLVWLFVAEIISSYWYSKTIYSDGTIWEWKGVNHFPDNARDSGEVNVVDNKAEEEDRLKQEAENERLAAEQQRSLKEAEDQRNALLDEQRKREEDEREYIRQMEEAESDQILMPEVEALEIIKQSSGWSGDLQKMKEKWVAAACEEHKVDAEWLIPRIGSWLKETGKTGHFTKITGEFLKSQKPS